MLTTKADHVLALFEQCAVNKGRCPTNRDIARHLTAIGICAETGGIPNIVMKLVNDNKIVVKIYARNWRVVTICYGANDGAATMEPPRGGEPYLVINVAGRHFTKNSPPSEALSGI